MLLISLCDWHLHIIYLSIYLFIYLYNSLNIIHNQFLIILVAEYQTVHTLLS